MKIWILSWLFIGLLYVSGTQNSQAQSTEQLSKLFSQSTILSEHFTGFMLYDPQLNEVLYAQHADKYFVPASNAKVLTLYSSLSLLGDSIPALRYVEQGDSLIFWGTGDPTFLNKVVAHHPAFEFLKATTKTLYYVSGNYNGSDFGHGWEWNDYAYYYQPEISAFPIYGNTVWFSSGVSGNIVSDPYYFTPYILLDYSVDPGRSRIVRDKDVNKFRHNGGALPRSFSRQIPFKTSAQLTIALLSDTLHKQVNLLESSITMPETIKTVYSHPVDTVLKIMMHDSDNHLAEQLLLVCASEHIKTILDGDSIRRYIKDILADLPHEPRWYDGSGLSRHNLITPATMVVLLTKLTDTVADQNRLLNFFPAGGKSGTLKTVYKTNNGKPFVWAKTGTLSNNHNQSGYLVTKKGRKLIFSFMNNNFVRPTAEIRRETARLLTRIHEDY